MLYKVQLTLILCFFVSPALLAYPSEDDLAPWVGKHQSALIDEWGPPTRETTDGRTGKILVYEEFIKDRFHNPNSNEFDRSFTKVSMFYVNLKGYIYRCKMQIK